MIPKTVEEFIEQYRSGVNPVTGKQNLFKDISDQMIWDAAIKSVEAVKRPNNKQMAQCRFWKGKEQPHAFCPIVKKCNNKPCLVVQRTSELEGK